MGRYSGGAVTIHTIDSGTAIAIGAITGMSIPTGVETVSDDGMGLYDVVQSVVSHQPVPAFTTKSVKTVLQQIGINGQCINVDGSHPGVKFFSRKLNACNDPATTSSHFQWLIRAGLMRLARLDASRGRDATISVIIDALSDGTNAPVSETDGVALPTGMIAEQYTLGVCGIGAVRFTEIDDVTLDFGTAIFDKLPALASIWPESVGVVKVRPVLQLRGNDIAKFKSTVIPLSGAAATHANTKIQLVRRAPTGFSLASSVNIWMTMAGLIVPRSLIEASGGSEALNELTIIGLDDGTNAPVMPTFSNIYDTSPEA